MGSVKKSMALTNAAAQLSRKARQMAASYDESQGNVFRRHIKTDPNKQMLAEHRRWMDAQQKEYPMPYVPYRVGVYIRYYNQTRHENYIEKHTQQFADDIALTKMRNLFKVKEQAFV